MFRHCRFPSNISFCLLLSDFPLFPASLTFYFITFQNKPTDGSLNGKGEKIPFLEFSPLFRFFIGGEPKSGLARDLGDCLQSRNVPFGTSGDPSTMRHITACSHLPCRISVCSYSTSIHSAILFFSKMNGAPARTAVPSPLWYAS